MIPGDIEAGLGGWGAGAGAAITTIDEPPSPADIRRLREAREAEEKMSAKAVETTDSRPDPLPLPPDPAAVVGGIIAAMQQRIDQLTDELRREAEVNRELVEELEELRASVRVS